MGLARVEKVQIIASSEVREDLLTALQEVGILQLEELEKQLELQPVPPPSRSLEPLLFRLRQAIRYLSLWKKSGLTEKLLSPRRIISREERQAVLNQDWDPLIREIESLEARRHELMAEIKALEKEKEILLPWKELDVPVREIKPTENVDLLFVRLARSHLSELEALEEEAPLWFRPIATNRKSVHLVLILDRQARAEMEEKLKDLGVSFLYFPDSLLKKASPDDRVADLIRRLEGEIVTHQKAVSSIEVKSREQAGLLPRLTLALDVLENEQERILSRSRLGQTEKTVFIEGWICSADLPRLESKLAAFAPSLEIFHRPPLEGEEPPVVLKNPPPFQPFEIITRLYGYPRPGTIDPTLPLAPFFFFFVGLCVSEAGYGFLVALLSLFFLLKVRPKGTTLLFGRLMFLLGLSTMILGTLVGGWFGFPIRKLLILDPLQQPVRFLVLALALGFVQVWFGTLLNAVGRLRHRKNLPAALTQMGWLLLLPSIVIYGLKRVELAGYFTLAGAALIVFFANPRRNLVLRFLGGLYGLYDISKYLGDVLSYSRLLALGLSTSVIAMVVNTLGQTALGLPVLGWVAAPLVFLGGHLFNLAISFLGGFVHSMRLQFVEFFTKFYESGGKPFRPFALRGKYVEFQ